MNILLRCVKSLYMKYQHRSDLNNKYHRKYWEWVKKCIEFLALWIAMLLSVTYSTNRGYDLEHRNIHLYMHYPDL